MSKEMEIILNVTEERARKLAEEKRFPTTRDFLLMTISVWSSKSDEEKIEKIEKYIDDLVEQSFELGYKSGKDKDINKDNKNLIHILEKMNSIYKKDTPCIGWKYAVSERISKRY